MRPGGGTGRVGTREPRGSTLARRAEAKVNLALTVTGRRADGYHTLRSVFLRIALADELRVAPSGDAAGPDRLVISGATDLPAEGNLVLRACERLRARVGGPLPALQLHLEKRIPIGAGLAGGSSDAAAALDLAAAAWGVRLDPTERLAAALRLGADVPFFAIGHRLALVGGIGELVEPLPMPDGRLGLVLVTPSVRLATADVFAAFDAGARPPGRASTLPVPGALAPATAPPPSPGLRAHDLAALLKRGLRDRGLADLGSRLRDANDLWPAAAALAPSLVDLRDRLEAATGRPFLLSGSGSTLFALYPSPQAARQTAATLARSLPGDVDDPGLRVVATAPARQEKP